MRRLEKCMVPLIFLGLAWVSCPPTALMMVLLPVTTVVGVTESHHFLTNEYYLEEYIP